MTDDKPGTPDLSDAAGAERVRALIDGAPVEDQAAPQADASEETASAEPRAMGFDVDRLNESYALVLTGAKAAIVREIADGPIDDRQRFLSVDAFRAWYGNRFTEIRDGDGDVRTVTWATAWLRSRKRRQFAGVEFFPDPHDSHGTTDYLNLWRGFAFAPAAKPGGWKTFRDHLLHNVCDGNEDLFAWTFGFFAHLVQRPRERIGTALVLVGPQGCGKTTVGEHFGALFPSHYFLVDDPRYVVGHFNSHLASCLLLQADEALWAGNRAAEGRLKGLVTSAFQQIELKGVDPIRLKNYVRLLMTSNESWVVPAGKEERRFAVLQVNPRCVGNHSYFNEMAAELRNGGYAALLHDLMTFNLASVDLRVIPRTEMLLYQKERSLGALESWWLGRLMEGCTTRGVMGWLPLAPTRALFNDYIATADQIGVTHKQAETVFGQDLRKLLPAPEGALRRRASVEGVRVWCYRIPSLELCRAHWDEMMGQPRDWLVDQGEANSADEAAEANDF